MDCAARPAYFAPATNIVREDTLVHHPLVLKSLQDCKGATHDQRHQGCGLHFIVSARRRRRSTSRGVITKGIDPSGNAARRRLP